MKHLTCALLATFLSAGAFASTAIEQGATPSPAVPVEPIGAILNLFSSYQVVGLGEGPHNNEQGHAFRLSLIRHPRFPVTVNDIVVESGTARYQDVMDRFIRGEEVAYDDLRRVWQDTTVPNTVWDKPIYEEFFRAVRTLNTALPKERQLRVLLGDPPIAWESVRGLADITRWQMQRDAHAAGVIRREVIAKRRRALVIYGDGHFQGRGFPDGSLVNRLERLPGTKVFTISSSFSDLAKVQPDVALWKVPSFSRIRGTVMGAKWYAFFYPMPPAKGWNTVLMQDQFDAVLYLGPPSSMTMSLLPRSLCADPGYMKMRLSRLALSTGSRGALDPTADLKQYCAGVIARPRP